MDHNVSTCITHMVSSLKLPEWQQENGSSVTAILCIVIKLLPRYKVKIFFFNGTYGPWKFVKKYWCCIFKAA